MPVSCTRFWVTPATSYQHGPFVRGHDGTRIIVQTWLRIDHATSRPHLVHKWPIHPNCAASPRDELAARLLRHMHVRRHTSAAGVAFYDIREHFVFSSKMGKATPCHCLLPRSQNTTAAARAPFSRRPRRSFDSVRRWYTVRRGLCCMDARVPPLLISRRLLASNAGL